MGGVPPHGYDLRYENERGEFLFVLRYLPDGSKQMLDKKGVLIRTLARRESLNISKRDRARLAPGDPQRHKMARFGIDYGACPIPLLRHWSTTAAPVEHRPTPVADPGHRSPKARSVPRILERSRTLFKHVWSGILGVR